MHDMYTAWLMLKTIIMIIILKVAGYVTEYDVNDFTFLTVKGAGHMVWFVLLATSFIIYYYIILCMHACGQVPQFKPKQAYAMFERFINRQPF